MCKEKIARCDISICMDDRELLRRWSQPTLEEGIIVGSDLTQEWLLPWWWEHYSRFNSHPVAFVDFGMSHEKKEWCKERGKWIRLPVADLFVAQKEEIDPLLVQQMEHACGKNFWPSRNAWFKKPLACLQSPFHRSLWIDLDCQINGSVQELFSHSRSGLAMVQELWDVHPDEVRFNAGVIVFEHGLSLIEDWADQSIARNHLFRGDQDVLNAIIQEQKFNVLELPPRYNWSRLSEKNPEAIIQHWHGPQGKIEIMHQIARANLTSLIINH